MSQPFGGGFGGTVIGPGADIGRATIIIDGNTSPFLRKLAGLRTDSLLGLDSLGRAATRTTKVLLGTAALAATGAVGAAVKSFGSFEDAFAGVAKTVEATDAELKELELSLRRIATEIPVNVAVLSDLARLAGQFGIAVGDIEEFTRTMALLSVTIDDLDVEEAATALARLSTIMRVSADDFDNLGSTLTDLGNKFASSEGDILTVATRIAGAGRIIGLTVQDVLGFSNAIATVVGPQGLEAASTAVQKILVAMNTAFVQGGEQLEVFAKTAGLSVAEFKKLFEQDAAEAFTRFVEGIGRSGRRGFLILKELGFTDARLVRSFLQLGGASELLRKSVDTANTAFRENIALSVEANKRFSTLVSQFQVFRNRLNEIGIKLGELFKPALIKLFKDLGAALEDIFKILAPGFKDLSEAVPELTSVLVGFISGVSQLVGAFNTLFSALIEEAGPALGDFLEDIGRFIRIVGKTVTPIFAELGSTIEEVLTFLGKGFKAILEPVITVLSQISESVRSVIDLLSEGFQESIPLILPAILEALAAFNQLVTDIGPAFTRFAVEVVERIVSIVVAFAEFLSVAGSPILEVLGEFFNQFGNVVLDVARAIAESLGPGIQALADAIVSFLQQAGPSFINVLLALVEAAAQMAPSFSQLVEALGPLAGQLGQGLVQVISNLKDPLSDVFIAMAGFLSQVGPQLVPVLGEASKLFGEILTVVQELLPIFGQALLDVLKTLPGLFKAVTPILRDLVKPLTILLATLGEFGVSLSETLVAVLEEIGPLLPGLVETFAGLIQDLTPEFVIIITNLAEAFVTLIEALGADAPDVIRAIAKVLVVFSDIIANLSPGQISALIGAFIGFKLVKSVLDPITTFAETFNNITDIITGGGKKGAGRGLLGALDKLKDGWGKLATKLGSTAFFTRIGDAVANLAGKLPNLIPSLDKIGAAGSTAGRLLTTDLLGGASGSVVAGAGGTAIGLLGAAAAGVGLGIVFNDLIEKHFPEFNDVLEDAGAAIADFLLGTGEEGQIGLLGELGEFFNELGGDIFDGVVRLMKRIFKAIYTLRFLPGFPDKAIKDIIEELEAAGYARGGFLEAGKLAVVGEEGPELIRLRNGSGADVFSNKTSKQILEGLRGGSGSERPIEINITQAEMDTIVLAEKVSAAVAREALR